MFDWLLPKAIDFSKGKLLKDYLDRGYSMIETKDPQGVIGFSQDGEEVYREIPVIDNDYEERIKVAFELWGFLRFIRRH